MFRKYFFILYIIFLQFGLIQYASAELLTNESIIQMSAVGLDDEIIISKIQNTPGNYDTSTDALINLAKKGVSKNVVKAIITAPTVESNKASEVGTNDFAFLEGEKLNKMVLANLSHRVSKRKKWAPFVSSGGNDSYFFGGPKSELHFPDENVRFFTRLPPSRVKLAYLGYHKREKSRFIVLREGNSSRLVNFKAKPYEGGYIIDISGLKMEAGEYAFMVVPEGSNSKNPIAITEAYDFGLDKKVEAKQAEVAVESEAEVAETEEEEEEE